MESHRIAALAASLGIAGLLAGCQTTSVSTTAAAVPHDATKGAPPELTAVTFRYNVPNGHGGVVSVVPDFHFVAPNGNVIVIHRDLVSTTASTSQLHFNPTQSVDIAADVQRKGAVVSGGWTCGIAKYEAVIRAYLMDADGNRSNTKEYTIHCNGG